MVQLDADAVTSDPTTLESIGDAVASGATAVILTEGASGASVLYEAACKLKAFLRSRASLLLVDRTDIASAAEADGVLLTDSGVPTVVAKRMMSAAGPSALVGRIVSSGEAAVAAAADGANLVLVTSKDGLPASLSVLDKARNNQRSGNRIPVLQFCTSPDTSADALAAAWPEGLDGVAAWLPLLPRLADAATGTTVAGRSPGTAAAAVLQRLEGRPAEPAAPPAGKPSTTEVMADVLAAPPGTLTGHSWVRRLLNDERELLLSEEKAALGEVMAFLEEVVPDLAELQLLRDALKQLDDLFLVVVVGEFNSGKSSVINALLGNKFLAEGILPTTNEISILKYSEDPSQLDRLDQQSDGLYVRYLPAQLLKEMNIVDTPGTNVILERQQRLTEEYVPRADLVLFVMSADRPFSESEVRFLEYIRQWRKKVVFVVNKVDMLEGDEQVAEVREFVARNAQRLLKLDDPAVLTVSSRAALRGKLEVSRSRGGASAGILDSIEDEALTSNRNWLASGFGPLESFMVNFLVGTGSGAGEGVRLKLQTPLYVADALVGASARKLQAELEAARAELEAVRLVERQLKQFQAEMEKDAGAQRDALLKLLAETTSRVDKFVDRTIQISNLPVLINYVTGSKTSPASSMMSSFEAETMSSSLDTLKAAVMEHSRWLNTNCSNQLDYYTAFVNTRGGGNGSSGANGNGTGVSASGSSSSTSTALATSGALTAVTEFNPRAAAALLEEEVREVIVGTAGTAVGGPLGGLLAAQVITNTLEDLLVVAVGGLASYIAVLNLPLRRAEVKSKVSKIASNFVSEVQDKMKTELETQVSDTVSRVRAMIAPLERSCEEEVARLEAQEARREALARTVLELQRKTAAVE